MRKIHSKKQFEFVSLLLVSILLWVGFSQCNKTSNTPTTPPTNPPVVPVTSKIIYTNVSADSILLGWRISQYELDLNNDGVKDFVFDISYDTFECDVQMGMSSNFIANPIGANQIEGYDSLPNALDTVSILTDSLSATIGPVALWSTSSNQMIVEVINFTSPPAPPVVAPADTTSNPPLTPPDSPSNPGTKPPRQHRTFPFNHISSSGITPEGNCSNTIVGNWIDMNSYYLGLKLISGGHIYYGWARLSYSSYSGFLFLFDYAYNSIPDQPILAGQKK
jgi:hypothetical protein